MILDYLTSHSPVQFAAICAFTIICVVAMIGRQTDRSAERDIQAKREERMQIDYKPDKKKPSYD